MSKFNKSDIVAMLKEGVHTIVFTKKDGTERTMKATLLKETVEPLLVGGERNAPDNIVAVVDTDLNAWRSFDINSLKSID